MYPPRMSAPSCIVPHTEQLVIRPHIVPLLPTFHGMGSKIPYAHIKEFEDVCNTFQEGGASIDLMRLKLFPFTLKDKAKIWLNSLRPRSIRTWTDMQAEFLKKFFPTHRTNGLKMQISNFSAKRMEKFYECWERYMEAINACPHHGFDTWLLVSYFYDGMPSSMKQLLETMCRGDFMSKNLEEAMDFLSYVAEVSRGWDEPNKGEVAVAETLVQVKPCPICQSYEHLVEECPTIPAAREMFGEQANVIGQFKPNNNASYGNTYNSNWRNHPNFSWKPRAPQYTQPAQPSQQASNLEQAIVNLSKVVEILLQIKNPSMLNSVKELTVLTNLNTVQEKGRFPSQPHQNPKGIHEVETHEGESSQVRDVKGLITLRSGKKVELPTPKPHVKEEEKKETEKREEIKGKKKDTSEGKVDHDSIVNAIQRNHDWGNCSGESFVRLGSKCEFPTILYLQEIGLGELKPTSITLSLADRSVKIPMGIIEDVLVQVDNFYYLVDFVVLDTDPIFKETNYVPIILGSSFLATSNAIINCRNGLMQLMFGNMTLELNIFYMSKKSITPEEERGPKEVCIIDTLVEEHCNQKMQDRLNESLGDLEEGLPEPSNVLATLQGWRRREEILPLFNKDEA
ncbi:hypothetical protein CK203_058713 [Vitis vinifera]|uniref:Retrotransposon gag domain-containing protein n=1 Tax=Vitis vinifera TaxID=29760 RepID=A0A438GLJ4_VITVI|nr:hypothetical protein CK203_058713 [Vitis vinifera]